MDEIKCEVCGCRESPNGPLLACVGLCSNFVHQKCYKEREQVGLCTPCSATGNIKAPTAKNVFVRVIQLTNLTLALHSRIESQQKEIKNLKMLLKSPSNTRNDTKQPSAAVTKTSGDSSKTSSEPADNHEKSERSRKPQLAPAQNPRTASDHNNRERSSSKCKQKQIASTQSRLEEPAKKRVQQGPKQLVKGAKNNERSLGVPKRPAHRQLYVRNIKPEVTTKEMCDYVKSIDLNLIAVFKLKPVTPRSSRWCILIEDSCFEKSLDPTLWDQNVLFREFEGFPRKHEIIDSLEVSQ